MVLLGNRTYVPTHQQLEFIKEGDEEELITHLDGLRDKCMSAKKNLPRYEKLLEDSLSLEDEGKYQVIVNELNSSIENYDKYDFFVILEGYKLYKLEK